MKQEVLIGEDKELNWETEKHMCNLQRCKNENEAAAEVVWHMARVHFIKKKYEEYRDEYRFKNSETFRITILSETSTFLEDHGLNLKEISELNLNEKSFKELRGICDQVCKNGKYQVLSEARVQRQLSR